MRKPFLGERVQRDVHLLAVREEDVGLHGQRERRPRRFMDDAERALRLDQDDECQPEHARRFAGGSAVL